MNFMESLNVKADEVKRPPLPPLGTYRFVISKLAYDEVGQGKYNVVNFTVQAREMVDGDESALADYGKVEDIIQRVSFMFPTDPEEQTARERAKFNMKRFLVDTCGGDESKKLRELAEESIGWEFLGTITYRPDKTDKEIMYPEVSKHAPIE